MLLHWLRSKLAVTPEPQGGKVFSQELEKFARMLESDTPFALSRFNDGEMTIIFGEEFNSAKNRIGNTYIPHQPDAEKQRKLLTEALTYKANGYIVGIVCPCCEGYEKFQKLKQLSNQSEDHLTWANVFVNSNFPKLKSRIEPIFKNKDIVFIGNALAKTTDLSFIIKKKFTVGDNAWLQDYDKLLIEMSTYIEQNNIANNIFIFCAGVLSNLIIHKLHKQFPNNTYLDLGSVFDIELGLGKSRRYLRKGKTLYKTCVWG